VLVAFGWGSINFQDYFINSQIYLFFSLCFVLLYACKFHYDFSGKISVKNLLPKSSLPPLRCPLPPPPPHEGKLHVKYCKRSFCGVVAMARDLEEEEEQEFEEWNWGSLNASTAADTTARCCCCCSSRRLRLLRKTWRDADLLLLLLLFQSVVSKKDSCVFEFSCKLGFHNLLKILLFYLHDLKLHHILHQP
jgi:hypothetical protein